MAVSLPFEWQIGWRYTRAGRGGRRNAFISFISGMSIIGIALGVAALIIVLSVMNGFQKEVRERMLSVIPHIEVFSSDGEALADWQALSAQVKRHPEVRAASPFIATPLLLARGDRLKGGLVRGIEPTAEASVTPLGAQLQQGVLATLRSGEWQVVLGSELARSLAVGVGDPVTLVVPAGNTTPVGVTPRLKTFTVSGLFESGHFEYDSSLALIHLEDAERLFRLEGPSGLQLRIASVQDAAKVAAELAGTLPPGLLVRDWTRTNRQWFEAVQIEKRMMGIILTLIVAVAAFNLVSTLVMTVTDKQADIAILRTLGASPSSVMAIFVVQGAMAGLIGTATGVGLGLLVAFNVDVIVPAIEQALGVRFLPGSIYLITRMPSEPLASDVIPIAIISLVLSLVATLYPSWRASRVNPAQALRHE
jgi:lipoprotein-releasing system permease protein